MHVAFLKVTPKLAVESLRGCIVSGSELRETLIDEYHSNKYQQDGKLLDKWGDRVEKWIHKSLKELFKTYSSPVEPIKFRDKRAEGAHIGMAHDFGDRVIKLEGKIEVLNDMYSFILNNSNITINARGDVIFQSGDDNIANQNGKN